jgi:hypothetical protein
MSRFLALKKVDAGGVRIFVIPDSEIHFELQLQLLQLLYRNK